MCDFPDFLNFVNLTEKFQIEGKSRQNTENKQTCFGRKKKNQNPKLKLRENLVKTLKINKLLIRQKKLKIDMEGKSRQNTENKQTFDLI